MEDVNYIEKMCEYTSNNNLKLLVVTHYCPTYKVLDGYYKKDKLSSLYTTNLDYLLCSSKINTWVCGHVHTNFDFISNKGTRVIGNQKGKPKDKITDFLKNCVIKI
jgi:Icc-related predicted phosphoesterase